MYACAMSWWRGLRRLGSNRVNTTSSIHSCGHISNKSPATVAQPPPPETISEGPPHGSACMLRLRPFCLSGHSFPLGFWEICGSIHFCAFDIHSWMGHVFWRRGGVSVKFNTGSGAGLRRVLFLRGEPGSGSGAGAGASGASGAVSGASGAGASGAGAVSGAASIFAKRVGRFSCGRGSDPSKD
jgi:hypothetical protein